MKTQPRVNEATTEEQPPWKISLKNQSPKEMVSHEKESAKTKRKIRTSDNRISKIDDTVSTLNMIKGQKRT